MTDGLAASSALAGRVAMVTGGSGGIGRALVTALAATGARIAIGYATGAEAAARLAAELNERGRDCTTFAADLTARDATLDALRQVEADLGPVEILVPNAGLGVRADLEQLDQDLWNRTLAVNLQAPFLLAQHTVPAMAVRGWGRVLFVSSVAAFTGGRIGPHYAASKAGLHGLVGWLSSRYAAQGVTVNAIAPGLIAGTGMLPGDPAAQAPTPVGRYGTPTEVADIAVAMLTSSYLTGKVVSLDGGLYIR